MEKLIFNKLVRDKMPKKIENNGEYVLTEELNEEDFEAALNKKLLEEVEEVINAKTSWELTEEIADLLEVALAKARLHGIVYSDIEDARIIKLQQKGGFNDRVFLIHTVDREYADANVGCLTCANENCEVPLAKRHGYEDNGKPKGYYCIRYKSCYKRK